MKIRPKPATVHNRFKELRTKHEHTREQAAELLGINPHTIYYWERQMRQPSQEMVEKICKLYNITPKDLLDIP